jgi:formiminoglutamase
MNPAWLTVRRAETPLILAMPHGGTDLPDDLAGLFQSRWIARRDADWYIEQLYSGLADATVVATSISRSVIDVNRDPSGASLYPGQATTELCPTTTFDGEPLYSEARAPDGAGITDRRSAWFAPYHDALDGEVERLRAIHPRIVVYDCHSIRSRIPRLFGGELPIFNIGTNGGATCDPALSDAVEAVCVATGRSTVIDGRFKGGWTTRHYGQPEEGVHAIQMELAIRGYLAEPESIASDNWPPPFDPVTAAPMRAALAAILSACLEFAR